MVTADRSLRSARRALAEHFGAAGAPIAVEAAGTAAAPATLHRVRFDTRIKAWPKVSIVVPSRDSYGLIARLLDDLATRTDYPDREVIVVDNGTTDARVLDLYAQAGARDPAFRVVIEPEPFNFSRQVNRGIGLASGEHVLLLNNDIEVIEPQWLREMVSCLAYADAGIVGACLLYPDMTLQHAGVIVGMSGLAAHWYHRRPQDNPGMMGRLHVRQSLSAVTAACMLISRSCLDAVGAFDEAAFAIAYNDVDYCMRAGACGYRVVWTPFARLVHHESVSRGRDAAQARFEREKAALKARHATAVFQDPAFSPWFSRNHPQPRLVLPDRLPGPR
jgi:GT2 family glycosyltransferase